MQSWRGAFECFDRSRNGKRSPVTRARPQDEIPSLGRYRHLPERVETGKRRAVPRVWPRIQMRGVLRASSTIRTCEPCRVKFRRV